MVKWKRWFKHPEKEHWSVAEARSREAAESQAEDAARTEEGKRMVREHERKTQRRAADLAVIVQHFVWWDDSTQSYKAIEGAEPLSAMSVAMKAVP